MISLTNKKDDDQMSECKGIVVSMYLFMTYLYTYKSYTLFWNSQILYLNTLNKFIHIGDAFTVSNYMHVYPVRVLDLDKNLHSKF